MNFKWMVITDLNLQHLLSARRVLRNLPGQLPDTGRSEPRQAADAEGDVPGEGSAVPRRLLHAGRGSEGPQGVRGQGRVAVCVANSNQQQHYINITSFNHSPKPCSSRPVQTKRNRLRHPFTSVINSNAIYMQMFRNRFTSANTKDCSNGVTAFRVRQLYRIHFL